MRARYEIPKPCQNSWSGMAGTDAQRFCNSCRRHVWDFSRLTKREAARLLARERGGVCAKITYDSRQNIIFKASRGNRLIGISLLGASALTAENTCAVQVKVTDPTGTVVPNATVRLGDESGATGPDGIFQRALASGNYDVSVSSPGFAGYRQPHLSVACDHQPVAIEAKLQLGTMGAVQVVSGFGNPLRKAVGRIRALFGSHDPPADH